VYVLHDFNTSKLFFSATKWAKAHKKESSANKQSSKEFQFPFFHKYFCADLDLNLTGTMKKKLSVFCGIWVGEKCCAFFSHPIAFSFGSFAGLSTDGIFHTTIAYTTPPTNGRHR
jgi:hypothetical protein